VNSVLLVVVAYRKEVLTTLLQPQVTPFQSKRPLVDPVSPPEHHHRYTIQEQQKLVVLELVGALVVLLD
jgi:hypothetical protein